MRTESEEPVWRHFNAAFKKADEAFGEAEKAFDAMPDAEITSGLRTGKVHRLNFNASTWGERLKLAWKFAKMTAAVLFIGKTVLNFKSK